MLPYARSLAHARGGSQDEEKFFTSTPSVYSSSLLPWLERLSYCLEYMSFSRFRYELLVHTPNTDVYRRILECRFTHFAPYVVRIETDVIVHTLPRPSTLAHMVGVQQFIRSHIARTIYTALPLLLDFPKKRRANRKVNILEMPSARL